MFRCFDVSMFQHVDGRGHDRCVEWGEIGQMGVARDQQRKPTNQHAGGMVRGRFGKGKTLMAGSLDSLIYGGRAFVLAFVFAFVFALWIVWIVLH